MERFQNAPEKYLQKKLEQEPAPEPEAKFNYLRPLFEYSLEAAGGEIRQQLGETEVTLQYSKDDRRFPPYIHMRKMMSLVLSKDDKVFVLEELFPDTQVYVSADVQLSEDDFDELVRDEERQTSVTADGSKVNIYEPIFSKLGMLALMHELGHVAKKQSLTEAEGSELYSARHRYNKGRLVSKDSALVLQDERDAWAWALQQLRPYLGDFGIDENDIEQIIHKTALGSYSEIIKILNGK